MNTAEIEQELHSLTEHYRSTCLWFLREDFVPHTAIEAKIVLQAIKRYGDAEGYKRSRRLEKWL